MDGVEPTVTVVIPHRDTPDWLQLTCEMWLRQTEAIYLHVIDTASILSETDRVLADIAAYPTAEVSRLGIKRVTHLSDPICAAMDYAFSRCQTEFLLATHVDVIPKRQDLVTFMLKQCGPHQPVVGWEMSPRGEGPHGTVDGTVSNGYPGHVCTIFHMPTMDRIGAGWSLRRAAHAFHVRRTADPEVLGWPDTETCIGQLLRKYQIQPKFFGRETNFENQETDYWVHARSRTLLGMTTRHRQAFLEALARLAQWREKDATLPRWLDVDAAFDSLIPSCPDREAKAEAAFCKRIAGLAQVDPLDCEVNLEICRTCTLATARRPDSIDPTLVHLAYRAARKVAEADPSNRLRKKAQANLAQSVLDLEPCVDTGFDEIENLVSKSLDLSNQAAGQLPRSC